MDELKKELGDLRVLVASITPVNKALVGHQDSLVRQYVLVRRRFDDAAFSVALYASFEKFIEGLVAAYAQLESRRLEYAGLPQKLLKKHISRTAEMLSRGRIGEGRYAGLTELAIVKNLFECLNGVRPYTLNEAAVVAHDLNLRASEIDTLFAAVGVENLCDRVRRADALMEWYCAAQGIDAAPAGGVPAAVVEKRLEGVVERRNQVTHRGGSPVDLLGADAMADAVGFIEALSLSVFSIAVARYLQDHHATTAIQLRQRDGDGPYKNGTVVVVEKPAQRLFVGQPAFVIAGSTEARWGRIQSLRINDGDVQAVEPDSVAPQGIGVGLDFRCPKGGTPMALSVEDDVVWSPPALVAAPTA